MDEKQRQKKEREYEQWIATEEGGRIYSFEIPGKLGWRAKYLKEVDHEEQTIRFWQEIYDDKNILREIHEKYPIDKGHQKL